MVRQTATLLLVIVVLVGLLAVSLRAMMTPTVVKSWTGQKCLYIIEADGATRPCGELPATYYTEWRK